MWKFAAALEPGDVFFDGSRFRCVNKVEPTDTEGVAVWFRYIFVTGIEAGAGDKNECYRSSNNNLSFFSREDTIEVRGETT